MIKPWGARTVLLRARVGSLNYNLHDALSDKDWKLFVLPSFDDLYNGTRYSYAHTSPQEDYTVHDIRRLADLILKGNPYFLEVLYSRELAIHKPYYHLLEPLFHQREIITAAGRVHLYRSCLGTYQEKRKNLRKGTATTGTLVERYGYDTKEALHAYRLLDLLERYAACAWNFAHALSYDDPTTSILWAIKTGMIADGDIDALLEGKRRQITSLAPQYDQPVSPAIADLVRQTIQTIVHHHLIHGDGHA
ncbi:DNA polymerase beta superfamily protein [Heliophilum fasciatum]|uniref:Putative nucleotidyltransferase n=1 Tax=Heliophilum fasciatum TaxID=35700 RepID=A0A4R2RVL3_9FIRM|nr:nucleotidyltransferase domain-containing protein [Heliophilum fasciatum]MCW2277024.1 hypothetical protein [Heliophilum fasciatum]TCP68450.1 putative nucleotidyltransferase [Heliophilum fasciatum]